MEESISSFDKLIDGRLVRKKQSELVSEGLLILKSDEKLKDETVTKKTPADCVAEGTLSIPVGCKIDGGIFQEMSVEELRIACESDVEHEGELRELLRKRVNGQRRVAYAEESDGVFFDWQRGEVEKQAWMDKVAEIKARFPK